MFNYLSKNGGAVQSNYGICAKVCCSSVSPSNHDYKNEWTSSGIDCVCSFGANPDDFSEEGSDEDSCQ